MKLVNGMKGEPIAPDYEMLRAALLATQASTATARASQPPAPAVGRMTKLPAMPDGQAAVTASFDFDRGFAAIGRQPERDRHDRK